ncbi:hypothetical protein H4R34_003750 [Dimargaris verticillata]|uniref:Roadblock/LAMTOR2 domain-containing protein n=1 Tax=Dimargaris verticillata TaxID=2761393 RepID=A0A9W8B5I6_9FUNG|nr:hypothetical protein H4R34_003750 [Dimargaris verticillata]
MLQQNTLVRVLSQALSGGVDTAIDSWSTLRDELTHGPSEESINDLVFILESGRVMVATAGVGYIALVASSETPLGNVRIKLKSLQAHLQEPLSANISTNQYF